MLLVQSQFGMSDIVKTNIRGLDFGLLLALDAVYQERSVTRAAERLALSQPAVSGMLNKLRDLLGDELFVRTSHGVVPTPRTEELVGPVKEVIASTQLLFEPKEFDPAHSHFDVRLCGSDYVNRTLLGVLAGDIMERAPNARVSLLMYTAGLADQTRLLDEVDILFTTQEPNTVSPRGQILFRDSLVCMSSYKGHRDGQEVPVSELCDLSNIILSPIGAGVSERISSFFRERGLVRNIAITVPDFSSVFRAMRYSELIAFLPSKMVRQYSGELKQLQVGLDIPAADVVADWHDRFEGDPRHTWIRERMLATVANV